MLRERVALRLLRECQQLGLRSALTTKPRESMVLSSPNLYLSLSLVNVSQPLVQASLVGEAIDRGPALVLVADEEMNYLAVNQYACDVLGYTREELLSLKVSDVAAGTGTSHEFADFVAAESATGRTVLRRKDGTPLVFEFHASRTSVAGMLLYVSVGFAAD